MSALPKLDEACRVSRSVGAYADGELEPNRAVEVEQHLGACRSCREELALITAMRRSLRKSTTRTSSSSFAERMRVVAALEVAKAPIADGRPSIEAVPARSPIPSDDRRRPTLRSRLTWAATVAVAAAAGFVVAFLGSRGDRGQIVASMTQANPLDRRPMVSVDDTANKREAFDSLIERLVAFHANPLPPETENIDDAFRRFEPYVGVRMAGTTLRRPSGAQFRGARIYDIADMAHPPSMGDASFSGNRYTAELRYTMQGHRITIYVFDPHAVPIRVTRLKPRVVHQSRVYVGQVRGFSVVATERSGVGYAMASDLDDDRSAQLVANFD